jgi:hypothetical protein
MAVCSEDGGLAHAKNPSLGWEGETDYLVVEDGLKRLKREDVAITVGRQNRTESSRIELVGCTQESSE